MKMLKTGIAAVLLAGAVLVAATVPARADWADRSDPLNPVVKDDPDWDQYAFDLPFANQDGELTFKDLARSDEPFVLFWWLTDCPLCHLQLPYVQQLYNESNKRDLGLRVVSICIDSDKRDCLQYIEDKGIKFDVLFDGRARHTDKEYKVADNGTPLAYVFAAGGKPAGKLSGFTSTFSSDVLKMLDIDPDEKGDSAAGSANQGD